MINHFVDDQTSVLFFGEAAAVMVICGGRGRLKKTLMMHQNI